MFCLKKILKRALQICKNSSHAADGPVFSSQISFKLPFLCSTRTACGERRYSVSQLAFYGHDKHHNQKQRGEGRAHFITQFTVEPDQKSQQEPNVGAWRQKPKQKPLGGVVCLLALHGLLSVFSYTAQDHLHRGFPPYSRLGSLKY